MSARPDGRSHSGRKALVTLSLAACLSISAGCGYRVKGSQKNLPDGIQSLGIPTFVNSTARYRLEQIITAAVLKEFSSRTRLPISSSATAVDAVLNGEIYGISASPVTFGSDTFGSAFLVTVQMAVRLVRVRDGTVLWEDDTFLFRERYVLNTRITDFFSEQTPALERLAGDFAASLASTILNR